MAKTTVANIAELERQVVYTEWDNHETSLYTYEQFLRQLKKLPNSYNFSDEELQLLDIAIQIIEGTHGVIRD